MKNDARSTNKRNFQIIEWIGWGVVIGALINSTIAYIDISADASTRAFAPLVFVEGAFFGGIGLVLVWMGRKKRVKAEKETETHES